MLGYEGNSEETRRVIDPDGWLHTGDQGYLDRDGYLYLKGRLKEMIVTSYGKNIYPAAIEKELEKSPYIKQAMVIGEKRPYLVALVVPEEGATRDLIAQELDRVSQNLARHEQIKKFHMVADEFTERNGMLTPTLKLRRPIIMQAYQKEVEELYAS
jgi:long-chain acyl-CoA synthetase